MSSPPNIPHERDTSTPYTVFHHQPLCHWMINGKTRAEDLGWPQNYERIAIVKAHTLEQVYAKTQHLHRPWWENPGVKAFGALARSTSIGDIVQDGDGQLWVVVDFGFEKLTGNLAALEKATQATIHLDILDGGSLMSVWCGPPEQILLGPVTQKISAPEMDGFATALEIACGRLLASLVTSRAQRREMSKV
ncbi:MAG: hypothetical protein HN413_13140 [Chloroflexi bacterium]|jgi:hypothetical protein|nr:hypothetical protein [Chloroflexota bacterium]